MRKRVTNKEECSGPWPHNLSAKDTESEKRE
jgi:hypothetical protein